MGVYDYHSLKEHTGHKLECVDYGPGDNVAIECITCGEVLFDYNWKQPAIYCTTYCNKGHRVKDGKPIGHECHVLPPEALREEMAGNFAKAIELLKTARMKVHRGVKES